MYVSSMEYSICQISTNPKFFGPFPGMDVVENYYKYFVTQIGHHDVMRWMLYALGLVTGKSSFLDPETAKTISQNA